MYEKMVKNITCATFIFKMFVFLYWEITAVSRLGFDLGLLCSNKDLLGLKSDKMSKNISADISGNVQYLAGIQHVWIPKKYWYMI